MLSAPICLTWITFRKFFQLDFFLLVIFAINIIFLVKIIHLMTKWQFVGLKRGITGLKQAWYASTIKFLDCQLTLGPDPPCWHHDDTLAQTPPSGCQLIYGWPLCGWPLITNIRLYKGTYFSFRYLLTFRDWPDATDPPPRPPATISGIFWI